MAVMCFLGKKSVLDKLHSSMTYSAAHYEFKVTNQQYFTYRKKKRGFVLYVTLFHKVLR